MRLILPALIVALGASGGLVGCGAATVSGMDVEQQITTQLSIADSASCPGDLDAKVGATITCTATGNEGDIEVEVTVTSVDGSHVGLDLTPVG